MSLTCSKSIYDFLTDKEPSENIYKYIDRTIQPDTLYLDMCAKTINEIVQYLYKSLSVELKHALRNEVNSDQLKKINVKEILKSGSLGKSTAVKEKSDIDLIIFLNGISSIKELSELMPSILGCLRNMMPRMRNRRRVKSIEVKRVTKFSVGLIIKTHDGSNIEMDLLPNLNITKSRNLLHIYEEMESCDEELRRYYSSSLSPIQKDFVNRFTKPAKVKNLIRFMKFWAKVEDVPLRSYFIELLVIYNNRIKHREFLQSDSYSDFALYDHMKECLHILSNCETLKITFSDNYDYRDYGKTSTSFSGAVFSFFCCFERNTVVETLPYLLDPAIPFMNVAPSPEEAVTVSRKAKELLDNWDHIFPQAK